MSKEIDNNELHQLMNDDKMHSYMQEQSGESDCCGAPVIDDYLICSDCKEHCDYVSEMCRFCGDREVYPEEDGGFCSKSCWNGHSKETFYDD